MKINVVAVGKLSAEYFKDAVADYAKRIARFGEINIIEINEVEPKGSSAQDEAQAIYKEGQSIIKRLKGYVVALAIEGDALSSTEIADFIRQSEIKGTSTMTFVIGGSLGLSNEVLSVADKKISFGKITYPHQLIRVVLTEQIYRAYMINNNCKYHK